MGMPIYVPLLLVLCSVSLIGVDVGSMEGAAFASQRATAEHANDNLTFVASIQAPLGSEHEIRTPGQGYGWIVNNVRVHRFLVIDNESEPSGVVVRKVLLEPEGPTLQDHNASDSEGHGDMERLKEHAEFIVIPTWELGDLAAGRNVTVLHAEAQAFAPHRVPVDLPLPPEQTPAADRSITLIWLVHNTTDDYQELSRGLLANGVEGRDGRDIVAINTAVLAWDPWLRGAAALAAAAAIVLAVAPRAHSLPQPLPSGRGGTSIDMAEVGERFLQSLRNAYVALAILLAVIGSSLVFAVGLYASMVASGEVLQQAQPTGFDWQATIRGVLVLAFVAGVLAASRPALDSHRALRRWRQNEGSPPVEGDLGQ